MEVDLERLILMVTGAHLRAEALDRPAAYRMQARVSAWLAARGLAGPRGGSRVLVCSDVWYLNDTGLRTRPTISIGGPRVNALTAFLADKIPSAFAIEDVLLVQAELSFADVVACCWGCNAAATDAAVDAFTERYLDGFMEAATRGWGELGKKGD
jgi:hypothetical protein